MAMRFVIGRVDRMKALLATVGVAATMIGLASTPAEARHRHHGGFHRAAHHSHVRAVRHGHHAVVSTRAAGGFLRPTYSSIIVDANTGRTLSATNESAPHHPASITKVMTLYLLFEQLEKGRMQLDSELSISAHAAAQQPTKLGLRPGSTIDVEDAIKAVVTRSANDIAVAIAENVGGDESTFADMMTRRARSLGMYGTTFRNASGLPNPGQITTARDLAILGRAIQDRFPKYYRYFATRTFYFHGQAIANHNHLLGKVEGVDGIKTGYTAASGFNLLSSVRRDGRHIVGVVLGGKSYAQRDHIMAGLIEDNLGDASTRRTAVAMAEPDEDTGRESARVAESAPDEQQEEVRKPARVEARVTPAPMLAPIAPPQPAETRRVTTASLDLSVPLPPAKIEAPVEKARPAFVTAVRNEPEAAEPARRTARRAALEGTTTRPLAYAATATPSSLRWVEGPQGRIHPRGAEEGRTTKAEASRQESKGVEKALEGKSTEAKSVAAPKLPLVRPSGAGWMIQIGATEDAEKAHELLARAKSKAGLVAAKPFTEKVQKGGGTLWRARFAGLEENSAAAACRTLKQSGFSCFATRN